MIPAVLLQAEAATTRMMIAADAAATGNQVVPAAIPAIRAGMTTAIIAVHLLKGAEALQEEMAPTLTEAVILLTETVLHPAEATLLQAETMAQVPTEGAILPTGAGTLLTVRVLLLTEAALHQAEALLPTADLLPMEEIQAAAAARVTVLPT